MSVREVLTDIRSRRLGDISTGYFPRKTALSEVVRNLSSIETAVEVPRSSRLDEVADCVRQCIEEHHCDALSPRDWRIVPWVMWQEPFAADRAWFLDALFNVITSRRSMSVVRALVHSYIAYFDAERESVIRVAGFLRKQAEIESFDGFARWRSIDQRFSLFDPAVAPRKIAEHALDDGENLFESLEDTGVARDRLNDPLAERSFNFATEAVAKHLKTSVDQATVNRAIDRLILWNTNEVGGPRYPASLAPMATFLLEAVESPLVAEDLADRIVRYFVRTLQDPRLNQARWADVSTKALGTAMRLLIRSTLEDFFRIIDAVAKKAMWKERKAFWLAYYEAGAINDAWVAFGPRAITRARALEKRYGLLLGAMEPNHSALILRIRDLILVEMSHNGKCRLFPSSQDRWRPGCYDERYDFQDLRDNCDLYGDSLTHMGDWRPRFAAEIYRLTRVRHPVYGAGY